MNPLCCSRAREREIKVLVIRIPRSRGWRRIEKAPGKAEKGRKIILINWRIKQMLSKDKSMISK